MVIIEVECGDVRLKTGRIVSDGSSHLPVDNRNRTVVHGNRRLQALASLENAHEKEFRVDDIHLLKAPEAGALRDPACAREWFGSIYQDWVINKILRALKRLNL